MGWITPDARRNGVHAVCPLARQNIQLRTGCKNGVINDSFGVPFTTFVVKLFFRLFWANERLDRWGTWPAPGRRSTGLGHQDPRSGEPSSRTGPPYSSWKNGEWKIQPRECGKCVFFFHLGGMFLLLVDARYGGGRYSLAALLVAQCRPRMGRTRRR